MPRHRTSCRDTSPGTGGAVNLSDQTVSALTDALDDRRVATCEARVASAAVIADRSRALLDLPLDEERDLYARVNLAPDVPGALVVFQFNDVTSTYRDLAGIHNLDLSIAGGKIHVLGHLRQLSPTGCGATSGTSSRIHWLTQGSPFAKPCGSQVLSRAQSSDHL